MRVLRALLYSIVGQLTIAILSQLLQLIVHHMRAPADVYSPYISQQYVPFHVCLSRELTDPTTDSKSVYPAVQLAHSLDLLAVYLIYVCLLS